MATPKPDSVRIVVNCPVCSRTVWANSVCHHGDVPPPKPGDDVPKEPPKYRPNKGKIPRV